MSKYFALFIVAAVALQGCIAKPKQAEKSQLEELAANAETVVKNVTAALGVKDLPDSKKIVEVLNKNTQDLANNVQAIVDKLKTEAKAHQPEVEAIFKQVEQKLDETASNLQKTAGPEATAKAKELQTNLDNGLKTAVDQVQKLVKAIEPDATKVKSDIQDATQTFINQLVELTNNLKTQVKATVEEHEKTHKH